MFLKKTAPFLLLPVLMAGASAAQTTAPAQPAADFQISGTLVDSLSGQPIAGARVGIAPAAERNNFTIVITGESGLYSFGSLAPGKYVLTAQARGYLFQSFNQHDQFASSIVVGPDLDTSHLLFRVPPAGAISGVVTDEAGEPVRQAQIALYFTGLSAGADATRSRGRTMTDDQGVYRFGHLAPGHYLVAVDARPWYAQHPANQPGLPDHHGASLLDVAYPVTFYGGATDAATATPLALAPGDKATANISLQPVPAVRIRVPADPSEPSHGTRFNLEKAVLDGPPLAVMMQWSTSQTGEQEIYGIAPGHYTMTTTTAAAGATASERSSSREINVTGNVDLDRSRDIAYVPVAAKLQFDPATRTRQVYLRLLNKKTRAVTSQPVSDEGEVVFKQGVLPGSYEISINNAPGFYLKSISASGATVTGRTLEVRPGTTIKLAISVARGQGQITGIASREKKPFAGAMIVLVPANPVHNQVLFRREQTDTDGSFTLPDVVPGAYTLLALEHGWELPWMDPEVLKSYMARGVALQVQPNGEYEVKVDVQ